MDHGPELRFYMNLMALDSFPASVVGPKGSFERRMQDLASAGFSGVQFAEFGTKEELACCRELEFGVAASARVNAPSEARLIAERVSTEGYECATVHAGWGLENDDEAHRLIEAILDASARNAVPLYVETHRATICQDMWRTVQLVKQYPEMQFNGDFSHWYAGQEMVYGGFEKKLEFIRPVIERVRFLHGRIANPGCIQVAIDPNDEPEPLYVGHFRALWTEVFRALFRKRNLQFICFTPELLSPAIFYARTFHGEEESDRWEQSRHLCNMALECFECARLG